MLGGYLNDELSRMDSVTLKDKPSHSIRCVYRADLILCRKLTDHLRKHVLQYYLIKVRIMYIKVPWTTMELARKFTSFSCQLQVWSASVSHYTMLLDNDITPSDSVRNLGAIFDSDFSFHKHVSDICKSCFYHIRDLRRIRRHIPLSTAKTISNALISSRLDYCNSLLNNIAKQDLSKLQRVQNCLARVVLRAPRFSPSLPLLKQLHWLPVNYRIQFKLSTLTYRALAIHQPPYLASLLHFSNIPRQLRSSTSEQLSIPRTKLNLGKRAFSVAAPIIWNELPTTLKSCESLASFRKNLKTYLFKIAFPP